MIGAELSTDGGALVTVGFNSKVGAAKISDIALSTKWFSPAAYEH